MLKGYKTFIIAILTVLLGVLGKHVAPEIISDYADVIIAGLGIVFAVLRVATSSPVFLKVEAAMARDLGLSDTALAQIQAQISNSTLRLDPDDKATFTLLAANLNASVSKLSGHPLFEPGFASAVNQLAENVTNITAALAASPVAAKPEPVPDDGAQKAAPQPQQQTPEPAPAPNPAPAGDGQVHTQSSENANA